MRLGFERQLRGENLGNMLRVNGRNYPILYQDFKNVVGKVGIPEPELYIYNSPEMNAYTYGNTCVFIALSSGLIEHLDREELLSVIGHECGHILCKHVLYKSMLHTLEEAGFWFDLICQSLFCRCMEPCDIGIGKASCPRIAAPLYWWVRRCFNLRWQSWPPA